MMAEQDRTPASFNDLLEAWRQTAADTEQRWNVFLNQLMGTEAFGEMMARSTESYVAMQSTFERGMEQYPRALDIPTRANVTELAERVALLEQKIDHVAGLLGAEGARANGDAARPAGKGRPRPSGRRAADDPHRHHRTGMPRQGRRPRW